MELLTESDVTRALLPRGFRLSGTNVNSEHPGRELAINYSRLTGAQLVGLTAFIATFGVQRVFNGGLAWIADWGFHPEDVEALAEFVLFKLRDSEESITEFPGLSFSSEDLIRTQALLLHTLLFRWDVYYFPEGHRCFFQLSNDEVVIIRSLDERTFNAAKNFFSHWRVFEPSRQV